MGKNVYSSEVKWAVVKDKLSGKLTTKEIMEKYGIKNESQIKTWMKWYALTNIIDLISRSINNIPMDMVQILRVRMIRENDKVTSEDGK
ncbi:helix-turn-helix domain-containing protein [Exiguobacterium sp. A1_3_1]|uniref:helix-turn-helix domain-containing protein n=1 Tax=Exiguobacterium sp. A1_3_1 TaxID=2651871 RepID=UPI003B98508C